MSGARPSSGGARKMGVESGAGLPGIWTGEVGVGTCAWTGSATNMLSKFASTRQAKTVCWYAEGEVGRSMASRVLAKF